MTNSNTAWSSPAGMEDPYFDKGDYLIELTKAKSNKNGDPYCSFKVVESHDGRRINMYATQNFNLSAGSEKAKQWATRKFNQLKKACGMSDGATPDLFIGQTLTLRINEAGYYGSIPISFLAADQYGTKKPSNVTPLKQPSDMAPPEFNDDDEIPF